MQLVHPSIDYKDSFIEGLKEFQSEGRLLEFKDHTLEQIQNDFEQFVQSIRNLEQGIGLKAGYVPETVYWLVDHGEYIGNVSIRHRLNEHLLQIGGHIGYSIRPSKRRQGYGTKILELALIKAKEMGIMKPLVTCDATNTGALKIIEANGGVLENELDNNGIPKRRYWIQL